MLHTMHSSSGDENDVKISFYCNRIKGKMRKEQGRSADGVRREKN
jgi:hypothetical protein